VVDARSRDVAAAVKALDAADWCKAKGSGGDRLVAMPTAADDDEDDFTSLPKAAPAGPDADDGLDADGL
jgi:hypothetical protein